MFYIARKAFPDRILDDDDLDAVADLWRAWHQEKSDSALFSRKAYQFLQVRLWGFARDRAAALADLLKQGLESYGLPESHVTFLDPDTICIDSPAVPVFEALPRGLWLDLFRDEAFDGLPLMLRLSISEFRGRPEGAPGESVGLVLVGLLRNDRLQLKAVWPNTTEAERLDPVFHKAVWPEEEKFLHALDEFQESGRLPPRDSSLFVTRRQERTAYWSIRLLFDVPGDDKLSGFLGRIGFFFSLMVIAALVLLYAPMNWLMPFIVELVALVGLFGLGFNLFWKGRIVYLYYSRMKAALRKLYSQSINYVPVDLAELGLADNPGLVKYTRELEQIGARRLLDFRIEPRPTGLSYIRLFQLPDGHSYAFLNVMLNTPVIHFFPAHPFVLISTYFDDGTRLTSVNAKASGFSKLRKPNVVARRFPDLQNPGELLARHREVMKRLLDEGRRLAPLMTVEGLIRRQIEEHDETCELAKQQGYYTWGAAFRQAFGIVRKEYLQDG
jgi:hypothetical protein